MYTTPRSYCDLHQWIHQTLDSIVGDHALGTRRHQLVPVCTLMPRFARIEHRLRLGLVPNERRERHVGMAECRLPQHFEAVLLNTVSSRFYLHGPIIESPDRRVTPSAPLLLQ